MATAGQDRVGPYRLVNMIRAGQTCLIYSAMRDGTGQKFALKLLPPEARSREQIALLRHEFSVGHSLEHPRTIRIYEFVKDKTGVYLTLEFYPYPNLKQLIQQNFDRLPPLTATIIEQSAEGLNYLHQHGWVHRDIKPDNFLINPQGEVKLIDFALAVRKGGMLHRLLRFKQKIQGTRSYLSPEQIRGEALDQRADIYSLGCVVHELLIGKPPFSGTSSDDLLNKHLRSIPPSLEGLNSNVTKEFSHLVKKMLAKNPKERPQSLAEFLAELKTVKVFRVDPARVEKGGAQ